MYNSIILTLIFIVSIYILYNLIKINYFEQKEDFKSIGDLINSVEDNIKDLRIKLSTFDNKFSDLIDEVEDLDNNIEDFFKGIKNFNETLLKKIYKILKSIFKTMLKKIGSPSIFARLLFTFFSLIWRSIKIIYKYVYKKHPEVRKIIFILGFIMSLPLLSIISVKISVLQLFLPPKIILIILVGSLSLLYFFLWDVFTFIFTFIINTLIKIDWENIFKEVGKDIVKLFEDFIDSLF